MGDIKALEQQASSSQDESLQIVPSRSVMTPMDMIQRALESNASMEVIEKFMALHERWEKSQAIRAFNNALADAKAKLPVIEKNKFVSFGGEKQGSSKTSYWHEDLAAVVEIVVPILSEYGLSHRWRLHSKPGEPITVTCIISHRDGHFEENDLSAGADTSGGKNAIQGMKSAISYMERITLMASLGLASRKDDDDGKAAGMGETINEDQLAALKVVALDVGANMDAFCKLLKVESLDKLPLRQFDSAMALLKSKRKGESKQEAQS